MSVVIKDKCKERYYIALKNLQDTIHQNQYHIHSDSNGKVSPWKTGEL